MDETLGVLSPTGDARRERILAIAQRAARRRRMRRRVSRLTGVALAVLVAAAGLGQWVDHHLRLASLAFYLPQTRIENPLIDSLPPPEARQPDSPPMPPQPVVSHQPKITIITTDPTILDRLSVHPVPHWQVIGDRELLDALAAAGEPAGLLRYDGRTILLPRDGPVPALR